MFSEAVKAYNMTEQKPNPSDEAALKNLSFDYESVALSKADRVGAEV
jgi:hypothetical protein